MKFWHFENLQNTKIWKIKIMYKVIKIDTRQKYLISTNLISLFTLSLFLRLSPFFDLLNFFHKATIRHLLPNYLNSLRLCSIRLTIILTPRIPSRTALISITLRIICLLPPFTFPNFPLNFRLLLLPLLNPHLLGVLFQRLLNIPWLGNSGKFL